METQQQREARQSRWRALAKQEEEAKTDERIKQATRTWEEVLLPAWREATKCQATADLILQPRPPLAQCVPTSLGLLGFASSRRVVTKDVELECWRGIPPKVRSKAWPALIGNQMRITSDLFELLRRESDETRFIIESPIKDDDIATICTESEEEEEEEEQESEEDRQKQQVEEGEKVPTAAQENNKSEDSNVMNECQERQREREACACSDNGDGSCEIVCTAKEVQEDEQIVAANDISTDQDEGKPKSITRKTSVATQIEQDLSRTFPDLAFFHEDGGPFRHALREILESYSLFRPGIGYVQGMSHIAAMLLLFMDRDPAFVCFCNILESHEFFNIVRNREESVISKHFQICTHLLEDADPLLAEHFARIDLQPHMFLLDWLLTLLVRATTLDVAARIWDCYLFYDSHERKERFLWRAIIAILKLFSVQLRLLDFDGCLTLLRNLPSFSIDKYFAVLQETPLKARRISSLKLKLEI